MSTAPASGAAINVCTDDAGDRPCILDLTSVIFLNSPRLSMLLEVTAHDQTLREALRVLVAANRPVIQPIEITGLDNDQRKTLHRSPIWARGTTLRSAREDRGRPGRVPVRLGVAALSWSLDSVHAGLEVQSDN